MDLRLDPMGAPKNARIDVRLSEDLKQVFEEAAAYLGQSLSEFVLSSVLARAREVQETQERTVLSTRDRARFLAALKEARPSRDLIQSAERYEQIVRKGGPDVDGRAAGEEAS